MPLLGKFLGYYPEMNSIIAAIPKRTVLGLKHVVRAINRENPPTGSTWALLEKNTEKSHKTVIFHLSGEKPPLNGLK